MNIRKLCEDSHRISKEKGWLENPRPFDEITVLFHTELSEAMEDYRNNRPVTEIYYQLRGEEIAIAPEAVVPVGAKPCGVPIELADFIIRIAQYCGTGGFDIERSVNGIVDLMKSGELRTKSFGETLAALHGDVSMAYLAHEHALPFKDGFPTTPLQYLASAWITTFSFCEANGIDLEKAIAIKQAYNETRPHRHGGKKC